MKHAVLIFSACAVALAAGTAYFLLKPPGAIGPVASATSPAEHARPGSGLVGSEACAPCHPEVHAEWKGSYHYQNMNRPTPETVVGDFENQNTYEYHGTKSKMYRDGDRYLMDFTNSDGKTETLLIDWVVGIDRHQVYLHKRQDGRLQVLPSYWHSREKRWLDSREGAVVSGPVPLDTLHPDYWDNYGRTYNRVCMECHSSQPYKQFNIDTMSYNSKFDPHINCESCHGAGEAHINLWKSLDKGKNVKSQKDTLAPLKEYDVFKSIEVCASCHARKRIYAEGYIPGAEYYDYYAPDVIDDAGGFFADGRSASLTYHFVDYMQSTCYRKTDQKLDCTGGCHPPHTLASTRGKSVQEANAICTRCHVNYQTGLAGHTRHAPESEGSRCVECHMPVIELDMHMSIHDHSIGSPLPELTRRFSIPNACNQCHKDDSVEWSERFVEQWYGGTQHFKQYRARTVERAEALTKVFKKDADFPLDTLAKWLDDPSESLIIRASTARLLAVGPKNQRTFDILMKHRKDPHPLVRYYIIDSLAQFPQGIEALREALTDPRRVVRSRAYESLIIWDPELLDSADPKLNQLKEEYKHRYEVVRADDPRMKSEIALWHFSNGRIKDAERLLRQGVALTEPVPVLRLDLVQFLMSQGRLDEADVEVKRLEERDPKGLPARLARGQILLVKGQTTEALALFDQLVAEGINLPVLQEARAVARRKLGMAPPEPAPPPVPPTAPPAGP